MVVLFRQIVKGYRYLNSELSDPRSTDYILTSSPFPVVVILFAYYQFIFNLGPRLMKNRPSLQLKELIIGYNILQILLNLQVFVVATLLMSNFDFFCEPVNYSKTDLVAIRSFEVGHTFLTIKALDLFDTVFFVLRKKQKQITFLHVYHHMGMVALLWIALKFAAAGHSGHVLVVNSFVHVIMYSYYLLSAVSPRYKNKLWWKKHITKLQLVQFLYFVTIYGQVLFRSDCKYPKWAALAFVVQNFFMLTLFWDFYKKAYLTPKTEKRPDS